MRTFSHGKSRCAGGAPIIIYCVIAVSVITVIAVLSTLVSQTSYLASRRTNMIKAQQYAQSGVVIACTELNTALTNGSGSLGTKLGALANPYTKNTALSAGTTNVYERTIAAPFTGQSVKAQICYAKGSGGNPNSAQVIASASVGSVNQYAVANVKLGWGYPGAIISVNAGTTSTSVAKAAGQDGNVVINGGTQGPIVVDGGSGQAVLANGRVNYDTNYANPPASAYSSTNWGTANQIPDYTSQGSSNALFDIPRFIAVADLTTNGYSTNTHNNHFTNVQTFINAAASHPPTNPMQGVIVVDVNINDKNMGNITDKNIPNGVNIHGTLLLNFTGTGWDPVSEKIIVTADMNINAADLSHLVATNPATYTTGYPPVYTDSTKNPTNIDITSKGYANFVAGDDLPAEMYTIGCLDMHGNANISGVLYTPSYMEIENKQSGQTQYFRGSLIMGNGIYYENSQAATSIISFDPNALDSLTTLGGVGKKASITYWQQ